MIVFLLSIMGWRRRFGMLMKKSHAFSSNAKKRVKGFKRGWRRSEDNASLYVIT